MQTNPQSEASMLREIIRERDARIQELSDKHFAECMQIAKYDDEIKKMRRQMPEIPDEVHHDRERQSP
ncbi:MAG: hypothetical protein ACI4J3_00785 [Oscillospiraceae bacterium]